jgi:hypothetical protein
LLSGDLREAAPGAAEVKEALEAEAPKGAAPEISLVAFMLTFLGATLLNIAVGQPFPLRRCYGFSSSSAPRSASRSVSIMPRHI